MATYRCFRCGRALSNDKSVELGIGPICRAKSRRELDREEAQRLENLRCHQGFCCYAPEHSATTMGRFRRRFQALAEQSAIAQRSALDSPVGSGSQVQLDPSYRSAYGDLPDEIMKRVLALCAEFAGCLGHNRDPVEVPAIEVPRFGPQTIVALNIPENNGSYKMPIDHDEQYRRLKLRQVQVCPFTRK